MIDTHVLLWALDDVTTLCALAVETLPPHHVDPFDRLLVAQAQMEKLTLVTRDTRLQAYAVPIIWA
ncbi:MAG: PIN domain-containing protein [Caldilinea sp.]